jgi:hypothetical protein
MPKRVRSGWSSHQPPGVETAGRVVAREQLDLPFGGLSQERAQVTPEAIDRERVSFLSYTPLVTDWLGFLAERLTAEFPRDLAGGSRP